ncbi:MAG: putative bifunctional diguanylate cyclase/phosphodiesterase [Acidiferrobacteraceae bacterium]
MTIIDRSTKHSGCTPTDLQDGPNGVLADDSFYETLFNSLGDAVFVAPLSVDGVHAEFIAVNDVACVRLGYTRAELLQMSASSLNPPENKARVRSLGRSIRREGLTTFEAVHVAKDGTRIPVEVVAHEARIDGRNCVISIARDLREVARIERDEARLGRLIDHSWDEIYMVDCASLRIVQANQGALDHLGYSRDELLALRVPDINPTLSEPEIRQMTRPLHEGMESRIIFETEHRRKDGRIYPIEARVQISHNEVPPVYLVNIHDITDRRKAEEHLSYLANYDTLTGLPNRSLFLDRMQHAIARTQRNNTLLAVLFIDLDGFKVINDSLGHQAGDSLLREIGLRLLDNVRASDTVARLSGDEFTVVLGDIAQVGHIETVAEKLIRVINEPLEIDGQKVRISASIGITVFPFSEGVDVYELLQQADSAMYEAKRTGKNRHRFYTASPLKTESRRLRIERELRLALQRGELHVEFQPRLALRGLSVCGAEALMRWSHPEFGQVPPGEFIPMMEASGLIREATVWILSEAVKQMADWPISADFKLSINISSHQLENEHLLSELSACLEAARLPMSRLEIEITESGLINHAKTASRVLHEIKEYGITIALDDFGSGYSSLGYLRQFPIDCLKIDRSFIAELPESPNSAAIVTAVISLAKTLRLKVSAEGIETPEQLAFLNAQGCREGQGYLFARSMSATDFRKYLISAADRVILRNDRPGQGI